MMGLWTTEWGLDVTPSLRYAQQTGPAFETFTAARAARISGVVMEQAR